jgi:hypothetical protein
MHKSITRMLILVAAIVAMAIPVFSVQRASACDVNSLNNCTGTTTVTGIGDTVTSPMTYTVSTPAFSETMLAGEVDYSVPGSLSIALADARGNNEGFVVQLSANAGTAPGTNAVIPASDYTVTSSTAANGYCAVSYDGGSCSTLEGIVPTSDLSTPQTIGCASALTSGAEGYGMYTLDEGLLLGIPTSPDPGFINEIFGTNPKSWRHSFNVTVLQGPAAAAVAPTGCTVE